MPAEPMGQGEVLPAVFRYEGEWILCLRIFLYAAERQSVVNDPYAASASLTARPVATIRRSLTLSQSTP